MTKNDVYSNLINLYLSTWDIKKVIDMNGMFRGCTNLKTLNLSGFETTSSPNIGWAFDGAILLQNLDFRNASFTKAS